MTTLIVIIGWNWQTPCMAKPIEQLINEVRLFYQSLVQIGDELHGESNISMGMRAVLEYLDRNGDTTVPRIARARRVTRQRIQTLVNSLFQLDLAMSTNNPESKRSPLIRLTKKGASTILDMRRLEGREMKFDLADNKIKDATRTLAQLRESLEKNRNR
jgi:DNA-binding MarR family transcriptional regulator